MKNRTSKIFFSCSLLVLPAIAQPALPAQAAPAGSSAIADYSRGQYRSALGKFNQTKARDANSRYYAALCEQNLNLITDAKTDYTWVSTYGAEPLRSYARSGLANLGRLRASGGSSGSNNMSAIAAAPSIAKQLGMQEVTPTTMKIAKVMQFYTSTCTVCLQFQPIWEEGSKRFRNVEFVTINGDEDLEAKQKYNVKACPSLVYLDASGRVLSNRVGVPPTLQAFEQSVAAYGGQKQ